MVEPANKKMLSEDLSQAALGGDKQVQDVINQTRKKFYEWEDGIAMARLSPDDGREQDLLVIELLTTKLTKSQAKHVLSPLLVISSRFLIHL